MKNPFIKENNSGLLVAAIVTGAIAAASAAWLYMTDRNSSVSTKNTGGNHDHSTDYLQAKAPHKRKHKTDLHELQHLVVNG